MDQVKATHTRITPQKYQALDIVSGKLEVNNNANSLPFLACNTSNSLTIGGKALSKQARKAVIPGAIPAF